MAKKRAWTGGTEGLALPLVLLVLVALGFISGAAAVMSRTDTRIARLYNASNRAGAAASAALEHGAAHFVTHGATSGWPISGTLDGYDYQVWIGRDRHDFGTGEVDVSYDEIVGYNGLGVGQPVYLVVALARRGNARAIQRMRITQRTIDADADAAIQSNSAVQLNGNITVSGVNATMSGDDVDPTNPSHTGACSENKPAVKLTDYDEDVILQGSPQLKGNPAYADSTPPYVIHSDVVVWHSPEEVLGLDPGALDPYRQTGDQYATNRPDTLSGITYITDNFGSTGACATNGGCGNIQGTGVLIVHNPLYDPREHDPSDPLYDPDKAADPAYQPANVGNINGGTFKGVIIADKIDKIDGTVNIYGAIVSLTEIHIDKFGAGTAVMKYSCQAIQTIESTILIARRLTWVAD